MLDKGKMSSPGRKKAQDNQADLDVPQAARIHPKFQQSIRDYDEELALNENKNSRRLPFRFCE